MKYLELEFIDNFYDTRKVVSYDEIKSFYYVTRVDTNGYELMKESDIEFYLNKQEKYKTAIERKRVIELEEQYKSDKEIEKLTKVNSFLNTIKSNIQRGKADKHLMSSVCYNDTSMSYYAMIELLVDKNYNPTHKSYTYRSNGRTFNKSGYVMESDSFVDITKTQYDYAMYLLGCLDKVAI